MSWFLAIACTGLLEAQVGPAPITSANGVPDEAAPAPATSARPASEIGWQDLDRVVMLVNQDVFVAQDLTRSLQRVVRAKSLTTETEIRAAERQILGELVRERLRVQAGMNLGVDEKLIDRRVQENLRRLEEREQGVIGLARFLESRDVSGPDARKILRDEIYEQIWTACITGEGPGPLGRPARDRWIRPGATRLLFQQALERPAELEAIGGSTAKVKFQQIILDVTQSGGPEAARALALSLKGRIEAGEDMAALVQEYGVARDGDGITEADAGRLKELSPEIDAFTSVAPEGTVSEPIASTSRGQELLRVVKLLERRAAHTPAFEDARVQEKLRKRAQERLTDFRLESAYRDLIKSSYVWPPELAVKDG